MPSCVMGDGADRTAGWEGEDGGERREEGRGGVGWGGGKVGGVMR